MNGDCIKEAEENAVGKVEHVVAIVAVVFRFSHHAVAKYSYMGASVLHQHLRVASARFDHA